MTRHDIVVLDEPLANQIAAGEVVERPSSVVKELVENALDAGSTIIDIEVEEGGLKLIRVTDNGSGIAAAQIPTAFLRHATSKIRTSADLFRIATLGFRGEALPSIAAIARVELISATDDSGLAHRYALEGGKELATVPTNAPRGTTVSVAELFFNTPARLKYMKSLQTELGHITDYVNRLALARADVAFTLTHDGNELIRTLGNGDLKQTFAAIYGVAHAKALIEVHAEDADYKLSGYIGSPQVTRASRTALTTIVNGRYVRSFALQQALLQAYHTLLPINRYPLAVIHVEMHPSLVDVNVHPAKLEVRFSKEPELRAFVEQAVRAVLSKEVHIPSGMPNSLTSEPAPTFTQGQITFHRHPAVDRRASIAPAEQRPSVYEAPQHRVIPKDAAEKLYAPSQAGREPLEVCETGAAFPELYYVGQAHGTYLIAQNASGIYLIDQHAAHERIHYEYYVRKFGEARSDVQPLLVPFTFELSATEVVQLKARLDLLIEVGVDAEWFGTNSLLVRGHPQWMPAGEERDIIEEMIELLILERAPLSLEKLREKAAIMCSCKASIKANEGLTRDQAEALLARLAQCAMPYTCPHGRPILVHLSSYQLEKMFKRIL